MALRNGRLRKAAGRAGAAAAFGLAVALAGCGSGIDAWRSVNGLTVNDPDPKAAPFTGNMTAALDKPYPNLASVPPPPTRATSTAEREKLTQDLVADRAATAAQAPPPPIPAAPAEAKAAANKAAPNAASATPTAASSTPATVITAVAAAPAANAAAPPTVVADAAPSEAATPGAEPAPAPPAPGPAAAPAKAPPDSGKKPAATRSHARKPGEPPEPSPLNSTLEMPQIKSVPTPEAARPPPPLPSIAPPRAPPPAVPPAAAMASVAPLPAPAAPVLGPAPPPPAAAKPPAKSPSAGAVVATLELGGATAPTPSERAEIDRVAALYRTEAGIVRIEAFAAAPARGADPLTSYHAALERAQGIAKALTAAGVPADKVQTEATPAAGPQIGRVEIRLAR